MNHPLRLLRLASLYGLVLVSVGTGQAQSNNFTGATAGQWNVGANWSLGTVPTSSQDVFSANGTEVRIGGTTAAVAGNLTIGGASGTSVVALRNDSANSLTVSGNITLAPGAGTGQLSLGTGSGFTSTLTIGGGSGSILDGGGAGLATIAIFGHMGTLGLATATADNLNINQNSSGSLTIGSGQTYTIGTTRVGSGTTNVTDALTVNGTLVGTTINPGASAANGTNSATFTLNTGGLVQATTLRRTGSQNITFDWNGGTIQNRSGGNLTVDATSGTLTIGLAGTGTHTFEADSGRTITVASTATLVDKAGQNGTLTKAGAGVLALNGSNTHSGVTTVNAGTLQLGDVNALQNSTLDTGTSGSQSVAFTAAGTNTYQLGGLRGSDDLGIGANTISVGSNNASTTFAGVISGTNGSLTKVGNGTMTLNGNNTYNGTTTVGRGTLVISKTNFTATITPTTMSVAFSNTPATNTPYTVLTGPLVGGSTNVTVTSPSGYTGSFDTNTRSFTVTAQSAGPTDASFSGWLSGSTPSAELLLQYAYGAFSAAQPVSRSSLPVGSVSSNGLSLTYYVRKNASNPDLVVPQWHTNLTEANSWSPVASSDIITNPITVTVDGVELIQKTATVPVDGARKFLRLKIAE
jgi:autotransporter-associated beta strand protein